MPRPKRPPLAALEDWQIERIEAGLANVKARRTVPADELFAAIAEKHGWSQAK